MEGSVELDKLRRQKKRLSKMHITMMGLVSRADFEWQKIVREHGTTALGIREDNLSAAMDQMVQHKEKFHEAHESFFTTFSALNPGATEPSENSKGFEREPSGTRSAYSGELRVSNPWVADYMDALGYQRMHETSRQELLDNFDRTDVNDQRNLERLNQDLEESARRVRTALEACLNNGVDPTNHHGIDMWTRVDAASDLTSSGTLDPVEAVTPWLESLESQAQPKAQIPPRRNSA